MEAPPSLLAETRPLQPMSLSSRLLNVFAAPAEVFSEVKPGERRQSDWLVPVLMAAVVGVINVWIIFSQPAVQQRMREQQAKQFQQMVDAGKMKAADAERAQEKMGPWMFTLMKITGPVGAFVGGFAWLFLIALVIRSVGLARLGGTSFFKAAIWLYTLWLGLRLAIIFSGLGASGM